MPVLQLVHRPSPHRLRHDDHDALRAFDVTSLDEARPLAAAYLEGARGCPRCAHVLDQLRERLGSTLFYDDDPRVLARSFDAADRDACTVRVLSACIVLYGRERVKLVSV